MSFDLFAEHGPPSIRRIGEISQDSVSDGAHRVQLLAAASQPEEQRELAKRHYEELVLGSRYAQQVLRENQRLGQELGLEAPQPDELAVLPAFSWLLQVHFQLEKPYLSRDDAAFYPIDSPVLKERVLRLPMVAGSGWKGVVRASASRLQMEGLSSAGSAPVEQVHEARLHLFLLFGAEAGSFSRHWNRFTARQVGRDFGEADTRKEIQAELERFLKEREVIAGDVSGRQGRLFFFPTFFERVGFEILNPHSRSRRVGKNPIAIECVPRESKGTLRILYVPFDYPERSEIVSDLELTLKAAYRVLRESGFGAKTSSGFGTAGESLGTGSGLFWRGVEAGVQKAVVDRASSLTEVGKDFRRATGE